MAGTIDMLRTGRLTLLKQTPHRQYPTQFCLCFLFLFWNDPSNSTFRQRTLSGKNKSSCLVGKRNGKCKAVTQISIVDSLGEWIIAIMP